MQTYPIIRQNRLVEAFESLTSLKNQNILSNLVSRRLEELEQLLCLYAQALPRSLQGEVFPACPSELNLGIIVPKSSRLMLMCTLLKNQSQSKTRMARNNSKSLEDSRSFIIIHRRGSVNSLAIIESVHPKYHQSFESTFYLLLRVTERTTFVCTHA